MPQKSSNFVKVRFVNKEKIIKGLNEIAVRICKKNSDIEGVYLFGSFVKDSYKPGSDADILVILKKDKRPIPERIQEYLKFFLSAPIPVDVFVYTKYELDKMKKEGNKFIERITTEAKRLN